MTEDEMYLNEILIPARRDMDEYPCDHGLFGWKKRSCGICGAKKILDRMIEQRKKKLEGARNDSEVD